MISGGLLGIVCVVAGGFCYFGFFLARLVGTMREVLDSMLRLEEHFEGVAANPAPTNGSSGRRSPVAVGKFVATPTGSMFHRPDCPVVVDRARAELKTVPAGGDGLEPCRICLPVA